MVNRVVAIASAIVNIGVFVLFALQGLYTVKGLARRYNQMNGGSANGDAFVD